MWDEFIIGGDVQETSKKNVLKAISDQDMIMEVSLVDLNRFIFSLLSSSFEIPFSIYCLYMFKKENELRI